MEIKIKNLEIVYFSPSSSFSKNQFVDNLNHNFYITYMKKL